MGLTIPLDDPSSNNPISQLEHLRIIDCDSLAFFPLAEGKLDALKTLCIYECEGVESVKEITVESLEEMTIDGCMNLGSLPQCLYMLSHLTRLEINNCPALEIEDFPPLPITLLTLELGNCPKMKSLPNQWYRLTSLQTLLVKDCQNIKCFPKGGFPPNLRRLRISGCENLKQPVREWGLLMLTSLMALYIDFCMGGEGEKAWFPDSWSLLFPSSLTHLRICNMWNVERLSSGLLHHLSSLQRLWIDCCPKLRYLPEDGLPPSLQELYIDKCDILKDRCSKHTGDYWPFIQEIPHIEMDWVRIQ